MVLISRCCIIKSRCRTLDIKDQNTDKFVDMDNLCRKCGTTPETVWNTFVNCAYMERSWTFIPIVSQMCLNQNKLNSQGGRRGFKIFVTMWRKGDGASFLLKRWSEGGLIWVVLFLSYFNTRTRTQHVNDTVRSVFLTIGAQELLPEQGYMLPIMLWNLCVAQ